jgi:anti-anti-sigma factor
MRITTRRSAGVAVVELPYEIDYASAVRAGWEVAAAFVPGARIIIVDLTLSAFADTSGIREVVIAWNRARADGRELRLVLPPVLRRIFGVAGADQVVPVYPTLAVTLSGGTCAG